MSRKIKQKFTVVDILAVEVDNTLVVEVEDN
jgi:hypothetical protein